MAGNIQWYIDRLKAMEAKEISWRISQKVLEQVEKQRFNSSNVSVIDKLLYSSLKDVKGGFKAGKIGINKLNTKYSTNSDLFLFNLCEYKAVKNKWNYGFNSEKEWPKQFAYGLTYKQNDDIGDARVNWELNRHYQFTILAKNYYITRNPEYLKELQELFYNWNEENRFLTGISWVSVMEISIRALSWIITLEFLNISSLDKNLEFLKDIDTGILNMVEYTYRHHSKYSSANNHLIVEMTVIGIAGVIYGKKEWYETAIITLNEQLFLQNYSDGVNKEQALHYQCFVMEAVTLLMIILKRNKIPFPHSWNELLGKMSEFIADNMDTNLSVFQLGDCDEGKLLDLNGLHSNHYKYTLELTSLYLKKRYIPLKEVHENINWLYSEEEIEEINQVYENSGSKCYKSGGYTIIKHFGENNIILVLDHAELGFGNIAAHGHADALSFTMSVNGYKVFIDPGTYIYHVKIDERNYFRRTINHNTICINNKDQSELRGAFLWGKKAQVHVTECRLDGNNEVVSAWHDGYAPITHKRRLGFNNSNTLMIDDYLDGENFEWCFTLMLHPDINITQIIKNKVVLTTSNNDQVFLRTSDEDEFLQEDVFISEIYGSKTVSKALRIRGHSANGKQLKVKIGINVEVQ
jgi:hypothetical protein